MAALSGDTRGQQTMPNQEHMMEGRKDQERAVRGACICDE